LGTTLSHYEVAVCSVRLALLLIKDTKAHSLFCLPGGIRQSNPKLSSEQKAENIFANPARLKVIANYSRNLFLLPVFCKCNVDGRYSFPSN